MLISLKKARMVDQPTLLCKHILAWPNLLSQSISRGLLVGDKAHKAFVWSCQAFVSGQKGRKKPAILESWKFTISITCPQPLSYLSAYHGICLTPSSLSRGRDLLILISLRFTLASEFQADQDYTVKPCL